MIQIQQNGLSPRATKGHRRTRSATNKEELCGGAGAKASTTPTPSAQLGRFFNDPAPAASILPTLVGSTSSASPPSPSSCKGHPKQQQPMRQSTTVRLVAMLATALAALLCTRVTFASPASRSTTTTSVRAVAATAESRQHRCAGRIEKRRGLGVPSDRQLCAAVLPAAVVESESSSWFVSAHVDRAPASAEPKRLRGTVPVERSLPHQYYVRAMEASLHSIATADPEAKVDIVLYSEGQWGGMVDEMGVPVEWDVPGEVCEELGLHCTQTVVLLNDANSPSEAETLECIAASDVLVASESKLSRTAAILSNHVKVLTDRWEMDEDELMVALNPATTIAGMPASQRQLLRSLVADYHECSPSRA